MIKFYIFVKLILLLIGYTNANYHGPFLLWGPSELNNAKLPALHAIDEKLLTLMYSEAKAIILFVRNGTSKLNKENFPSFSELISKNKWAYFPQEHLPAKPVDYNSNVEVITLVGPASQQDIELGALFRDTESVYGVGKVLGILSNQAEDGHFMYKRQAPNEDDTENNKDDKENNKDDKENNKEDKESNKDEKNDNDDKIPDDTDDKDKDINEKLELEIVNQKNDKIEQDTEDDDKNVIKYTNYTLFYRKGNVILYTKSVPQLSLLINMLPINVNLTNKISDSETWDARGIFSVKFQTDQGTIILRFNFPLNNGYWYLTSVEVEVISIGEKISLPLVSRIPYAPRNYSYKCVNDELLFKNENGTLKMNDFQVQAHLAINQTQFNDAYDCVGFMSAPIWSGILVSSLLIFVTFIGILALMSIKTPNRFESSRNKQLTFTVQE